MSSHKDCASKGVGHRRVSANKHKVRPQRRYDPPAKSIQLHATRFTQWANKNHNSAARTFHVITFCKGDGRE